MGKRDETEKIFKPDIFAKKNLNESIYAAFFEWNKKIKIKKGTYVLNAEAAHFCVVNVLIRKKNFL
jgi:hypothetical protein